MEQIPTGFELLPLGFGFCSGVINNAKGVVARFNGTFYLPDHDGVWKVKKRVSGILGE